MIPNSPEDTELYPPTHFVPDGYRENRLPEQLRSKAEWLVSVLSDHLRESRESDLSYQDQEKELLESEIARSSNWWSQGSERTVLGIGKTFEGSPIYPNTSTGVVLKFNVSLRAFKRNLPSPAVSGNLAELNIWKYVVENSYDDHFGTILDYAEDGSWVAMVEYLPYYRYSGPMHKGQDYITRQAIGKEYGKILQSNIDALDAGIKVHTKKGNVGLQPTKNSEYHPISIDYTSHTQVTDIDWAGV